MKGTRMKRIATALLLASAASVFAADEDWQARLHTTLSGKLSDHYTIKVNQETWWTDDASDLTYHHVQTAIGRPAADWLNTELTYRQKYGKSKGEWLEENRWMIDLTPKAKLGGWTFKDRNRFELRMRDGRSNVHRYRNKLYMYPPLSFTEWSIKPYVAEEFFIDDVDEKINQNRVYIGLGSKPVEHLSTGLYLLWETSRSGDDWKDVYVGGVSVSVGL